MTTASCKAKGRKFQQWICAKLLELGAPFGLEPDDVRSTSMGASGVDVLLSPAARRLFPFDIECKAVEALNVVGVFNEHYEKYKNSPAVKILAHTRNRQTPLVTMRFEDFIALWGKTIDKARV